MTLQLYFFSWMHWWIQVSITKKLPNGSTGQGPAAGAMCIVAVEFDGACHCFQGRHTVLRRASLLLHCTFPRDTCKESQRLIKDPVDLITVDVREAGQPSA